MSAALHGLPTDDDHDDDPRERRMGFLEHLDELRTRIIRAGIAVAAGMLVAFAFYDRLADIVLKPILATLPAGSSLVFIKPGEGFSFYLNISLIGGLLLSAPFVMYQVWRFIAPGLYANEKKMLIPFVALTSAGSLGGALFSHAVLFPALMTFYGEFSSARMKFMPGVEDTVDLYLKMMLGMVVVFQIPTVVYFLAKMRLVTGTLPLAADPVRDPGDLHRRRGVDAVDRSLEPDRLRRADDRPLPAQHRHRLAGRARTRQGRAAATRFAPQARVRRRRGRSGVAAANTESAQKTFR